MSSTFHRMGREFSSVAPGRPQKIYNSVPCGLEILCLHNFNDYVFSVS